MRHVTLALNSHAIQSSDLFVNPDSNPCTAHVFVLLELHIPTHMPQPTQHSHKEGKEKNKKNTEVGGPGGQTLRRGCPPSCRSPRPPRSPAPLPQPCAALFACHAALVCVRNVRLHANRRAYAKGTPPQAPRIHAHALCRTPQGTPAIAARPRTKPQAREGGAAQFYIFKRRGVLIYIIYYTPHRAEYMRDTHRPLFSRVLHKARFVAFGGCAMCGAGIGKAACFSCACRAYMRYLRACMR